MHIFRYTIARRRYRNVSTYNEKLAFAIHEELARSNLPTPEECGLGMDGVGNFLARIEKLREQHFVKRKDHPVGKSDLIRA